MNPLKPFNKIEQSLESMIEGAVNRVFRPSIQPSEIARRLSREMSERRLVSVRGSIVPNAFVVTLNAGDFASFGGSERVIADHLEEWLQEEADRLGFVVLGPIEVTLRPGDGARARAISIESSIKDAELPAARPVQRIDSTEPFVFHRTAPARTAWIIEVAGGPLAGIAHWIGKHRTSVGRSLDNDFVLDAPDVSRHHAVIERLDDNLRVADLGSLNGTFVNRREIFDWAIVKPGDVITFGLVDTRILVDAP